MSSNRKPYLGGHSGESLPLTQFPDVILFTDPGALTVGIPVPLKGDIALLLQEYTVNFPSRLSSKRSPAIHLPQ